MPEAPRQAQAAAPHVELQTYSPAALIAATLLHNELTLQDGLEAFDQDQDGRLSLEDMVSSSHNYQLDLSEEDIKQFHEKLRDADGYIQMSSWLAALEQPEDLADVLFSRGITAGPTTSEMVNTIAAALTYNQLSLQRGFEAFDNDEDGKISLADLQAAVQQLELEINPTDVSRLHSIMDKQKSGFVSWADWSSLVGSADGMSVLQSRGVEVSDNAASEGVSTAGTSVGAASSLDTVAATLAYNKLSAETGYDAFDVDEDGRVSEDDLRQAVGTMRLELSDNDVKALYSQLDSENLGYIPRENWVKAISSANAESVLKSRGVAAGDEPMGMGSEGAASQEDVTSSGSGVEKSVTLAASINIVAASLEFNGLSATDGYDAFDADEDGLVSLSDLQAAVETLQLNLKQSEVETLFKHLEAAEGGHVSKGKWQEAMGSAKTTEILQSRGVAAGDGVESAPATEGTASESKGSMPTAAGFQGAADTIAAALVYNKLSPSDGYDAFDVDEDGQVSESDLKQAVETLRLELAESDVKTFFDQLDEGKSGFISREAWERTMAEANADNVLKSRGVVGDEPVGGVGSNGAPGQHVTSSGSGGEQSVTLASSINIVAASLEFNGLSATDGYDAFDADEDGLVSLSDLQTAVETLELNLKQSEVETLFKHLEAAEGGHVSKDKWQEAMGSAKTTEILQSRGVAAGDGVESAPATEGTASESKGSMPTAAGFQGAADTIAAALVYNKLSPSDGYDAFDVDEDGQVSESDLKQAVETLRLELAESDVKTFFDQLDEGKGGFISREAWERTMKAANAQDILKSRAASAGDEPSGVEKGSGDLATSESMGTPVGGVSDTIGALLVYNKLSPRSGYQAFDADHDGKISLSDLEVAASTYYLTLHSGDMKAWHEALAKGGPYIEREDWERELKAANAQQVLQSRGVALASDAAAGDNQQDPPPSTKDPKAVGDLIAAALRYNDLSLDTGFDAFDQDQDGVISKEDVLASNQQLQLPVSEHDMLAFHQHANTSESGRLSREEWLAVLKSATPDDYLRSLGTGSTGASAGSEVTAAMALDMVAALLAWNKLESRQGFEQFDRDKDGMVSIDDLQGAVVELKLGLAQADVKRLHAHMDTDQDSMVSLDEWEAALGKANPDSVLQSLGIKKHEVLPAAAKPQDESATSDDKELEAAATKIQARARGMADRKQTSAKKEEPPTVEQPPAEAEELPELTEELESAAVKIQARARGMADRKQIAAKKEEPPKAEQPPAEAEELPELTEELESAAVKIQARARGMADRKQVALQRQDSVRKEATQPVEVPDEVEELPELTEDMEAAAVKIQARARGMADRKQVSVKRAESSKQMQPPAAAEDDEEAKAQAAVKIQARARGMADRRQTSMKRAESERTTQSRSDKVEDEEAKALAAVKIQARARGMHDRRAVSERKMGSSDFNRTPSFKQKAPKPLGGGALKDIDEHAITIQAQARGMLARKGSANEDKATAAKAEEEEVPELTEELESAAVKIQARARGMADRKQIAAKKEEPPKAEQPPAAAEELPELTEELESAAVKIQARARGMADRKQVALQRQDSVRKEATQPVEVPDEVEELPELTEDMEAAAVKIQARARGMADRKQVSVKRAESSKKVDAPAPVADGDEEAKTQAAVKIQARARGMHDRRAVSERKMGSNDFNRAPSFKQKAPAPISGGALKDIDEHATAIQAQARGMMTRKTTGKRTRDDSVADEAVDVPDAVPEEVEVLPELTEDMEAAAVKIQARARGMADRKQVSVKRAESSKQMQPPAAAEDDEEAKAQAAVKIQARARGMADRRQTSMKRAETMRPAETPSQVADEDEEAKALAAVKIQARARGMHDRRAVSERKMGSSDFNRTPSFKQKAPTPLGGAVTEELPELTEELESAAVKIQARARGMADRKQIAAKKEEPPKAEQPPAEAEELPELTEELESAAVKIQARARGMADRKQVARKKEAAPDEIEEVAEAVEEGEDKQHVAAVKIQARARGMNTRGSMREIKRRARRNKANQQNHKPPASARSGTPKQSPGNRKDWALTRRSPQTPSDSMGQFFPEGRGAFQGDSLLPGTAPQRDTLSGPLEAAAAAPPGVPMEQVEMMMQGKDMELQQVMASFEQEKAQLQAQLDTALAAPIGGPSVGKVLEGLELVTVTVDDDLDQWTAERSAELSGKLAEVGAIPAEHIKVMQLSRGSVIAHCVLHSENFAETRQRLEEDLNSSQGTLRGLGVIGCSSKDGSLMASPAVAAQSREVTDVVAKANGSIERLGELEAVLDALHADGELVKQRVQTLSSLAEKEREAAKEGADASKRAVELDLKLSEAQDQIDDLRRLAEAAESASAEEPLAKAEQALLCLLRLLLSKEDEAGVATALSQRSDLYDYVNELRTRHDFVVAAGLSPSELGSVVKGLQPQSAIDLLTTLFDGAGLVPAQGGVESGASAEAEEIQSKLAAAEQEAAALQQQLQAAADEKAKLDEKVRQLEQNTGAQSDAAANPCPVEAESVSREAVEKLVAAAERAAQLEQQLEALQREKSKLDDQVKALSDKMAESEAGSEGKDGVSLPANIAAELTQAVTRAHSRVEDMEKELTRMTDDKKNMEQRIQDLTKIAGKLPGSVVLPPDVAEDVIQSVVRAHERVELLDTELEQMEADKARLAVRLGEFDRLTAAKPSEEASAEEIPSLLERLNDSFKLFSEVQGTLDKLEKDHETTNGQVEELVKACSDVEAQASDSASASELAVLQDKIAVLERGWKQDQETMAKKDARILELKREAKAAVESLAEHEELKQEVARLESTLKANEDALATLREQSTPRESAEPAPAALQSNEELKSAVAAVVAVSGDVSALMQELQDNAATEEAEWWALVEAERARFVADVQQDLEICVSLNDEAQKILVAEYEGRPTHEELQKLQKQLEESDSRFKQLMDDRNRIRGELDSKDEEMQGLKHSLEEELAAAKQAGDSAGQEGDALKKQVAEAKSAADEAGVKLSEVQSKADQSASDLAEALARVDETEKSAAKHVAEAEAARQQVEEANKILNETQIKVEQLEKELASERECSSAQLAEAKATAQAQAEESQRRVSVTEDMATTQVAQIEELKSKLQAAEGMAKEMQGAVGELNGKLAAAEEEFKVKLEAAESAAKDKDAACTELAAKVESAVQAAQGKDAEVLELKAKVESADQASKKKEMSIEGLKSKLEAAESVTKDKDASTTDLQSKLSAAEGSLKEKEAAIEDLKAKLSAAEDLKGKLGAAEGVAKEKEAVLDELKAKLATAEEFRGKYERAEGVLREKESAVEDLKRRLADAEAFKTKLEGAEGMAKERSTAVEELKSKLAAAEERVREEERAADDARRRVLDEEARSAATQRALDAARVEVEGMRSELERQRKMVTSSAGESTEELERVQGELERAERKLAEAEARSVEARGDLERQLADAKAQIKIQTELADAQRKASVNAEQSRMELEVARREADEAKKGLDSAKRGEDAARLAQVTAEAESRAARDAKERAERELLEFRTRHEGDKATDALRVQVTELSRNVTRLVEEGRALGEEGRWQREDLRSAEQQKRDLQDRVLALEGEVARTREEKASALAVAESARVQLESRVSESEQQRRDMTLDVMIGKKEREGLIQEVERLSQEVAEGRVKLKAVTAELEAAKEQTARGASSPLNSPGKGGGGGAYMEETTAQMEQLQRQLQTEVERRVAADGRCRQLEAELTELRAQLEGGLGSTEEAVELSQLREEASGMQSKLKSEAAERQALEKEVQRLRAVVEQEGQQAQGGDAGRDLQERNMRVRALLKENAECHAQVRQLSAEVVGLTEALEMVTKKAQDKDSRHSELQAKMERIIRLAGLVDPLLALDAQKGPVLKKKKRVKAGTSTRNASPHYRVRNDASSVTPPRSRPEAWGYRQEEPPLPVVSNPRPSGSNMSQAAPPRRMATSAGRQRPQSARARIEQMEEVNGGAPPLTMAWDDAGMPPIEARREYLPEAPRSQAMPPPGGVRRPLSANASSDGSFNAPRPPMNPSGQPWKPPGTTDGVFQGAGGRNVVAGQRSQGGLGVSGGMESSLRPFSFLVKSVQEGLVNPSTPVKVLIEYCNSEHYSRRHDINRYQVLFERVSSALAEQLRGRRMSILANRTGGAGGQIVVEPRAGAFEVYVEWTGTDGATHTVVLFSKLESMSYPNPVKVAARLRNVLNGGEDGAEGGYGDSAEFIS